MTEHATESNRGDNAQRRHEPDLIWVGSMASIGVCLLLLVILTLFGISIAFKALIPDQPLVGAGEQWTRQHKAPGVQPNQAYERQRWLAQEEASLKQYAWQDKERGIARIPIDRGIEIMAQRNLNIEWPANASAKPAGEAAK